MGKSVALVVFALCISSALARHVQDNNPVFHIEGKVYCDPCQFEFESRLSKPLSGVKVTLECRKPDTGDRTFTLDGVTESTGHYTLTVEGDHQDEICAVKTEVNQHKHCNVPMNTSDSDRIVLTKNDGVSSSLRFVNPLGFKTNDVDQECFKVYKELELDHLNN
ncbi:hypothetical protein RIF29_38999 [Crotalaria pallida]|uniref:Uncharacterized protein n=1 Tax=Crotalaria pallida TaxID=3830 RepID=A0AAN9E255_CROPI